MQVLFVCFWEEYFQFQYHCMNNVYLELFSNLNTVLKNTISISISDKMLILLQRYKKEHTDYSFV